MDEQAMSAFLRHGIEKHGVPGAAIAVLEDGVTTGAAAGVLNLETQVPVTRDAMFQIGSITKVLTATLVMRLVDAGKLELDEPIVRYLPGFTLANADDAARITTRHLLSHTSGIDGDFFEATGRGEQALEEYVRRCRSLRTLHPVGEAFSYCNSGYAIAGRLVEVLADRGWHRLMREWLFEPLGMRHAATLPEDLVGKLAAIGHAPLGGGQSGLAPLPSAYAIPFSLAAAGATPTMSAPDLLRFAALHLNGGASGERVPILSRESVAAMQAPVAAVPHHAAAQIDRWGLGWSLSRWDGHELIGHDGNTDGQRAFLRALPEKHVAMALLTNGGAGIDLVRDAIDEIFATAAGLSPLPRPAPVSAPGRDLWRFSGKYWHAGGHFAVTEEQGGLSMRFEPPDAGSPNRDSPSQAASAETQAASAEAQPIELGCVTDDLFVGRVPPDTTPAYVRFLDPDAIGRPRSMFHLYRLCPRA